MSSAPTLPKRPLSIPQYRLASELLRYFGYDADVRRSAADVAKQLAPLSQRAPIAGPFVRAKMARFVALGLARFVPGMRGEAGWALTPQGADTVRAPETGRIPALDAPRACEVFGD